MQIRPSFKQYSKITTIYNGVQEYKKENQKNIMNLRKKLKISNAPLCLMLANYEFRKGHSFLFKAFHKVSSVLPDAHLVCCGAGNIDDKNQITKDRNTFAPNSKIHLLDFVPNGKELINQVDILLISSQYFESFGLSAVEAMIRRVPVVATNVGGLPEVLGNNSKVGFIVDPNNVTEFADKVIELLKDDNLRKTYGRAGRIRAKNYFSENEMVTKYKNIIYENY